MPDFQIIHERENFIISENHIFITAQLFSAKHTPYKADLASQLAA